MVKMMVIFEQTKRQNMGVLVPAKRLLLLIEAQQFSSGLRTACFTDKTCDGTVEQFRLWQCSLGKRHGGTTTGIRGESQQDKGNRFARLPLDQNRRSNAKCISFRTPIQDKVRSRRLAPALALQPAGFNLKTGQQVGRIQRIKSFQLVSFWFLVTELLVKGRLPPKLVRR